MLGGSGGVGKWRRLTQLPHTTTISTPNLEWALWPHGLCPAGHPKYNMHRFHYYSVHFLMNSCHEGVRDRNRARCRSRTPSTVFTALNYQ
eukprot:gene638-biopygen9198